jgi:glycosyltransferase involved in cell wall biosynthesis
MYSSISKKVHSACASNAMPLLSVIIPTYNAAATIVRALDSIITQRFTDLEIIVADGNSGDNTMDIVKEYAQRDKRIRYLSEKDNGVYDAMNKGVQLAKGEWLYFLGSDDALYENVLDQVFIAANLDCDVLYGNVNNRVLNSIYDGAFTKEKIGLKNICHQSIFIKRHVFDVIGLYDTRYRIFADWDHNFKWFFSNTIKHKYIDVVIADYSHGGLSSRNIDTSFENDKGLNYLWHGRKAFSFKARWKMLTIQAHIALMKKDLKKLLKVISYSPRILISVW